MCTTEIGRLAIKYDMLEEMDCKVATLSVDPVKSHEEWLTDVVAHCENKIEIKFPIIGDQDRSISTKYGMIDPGTSDAKTFSSGTPHSVSEVWTPASRSSRMSSCLSVRSRACPTLS